MYRRILVPVDGSAAAARGLRQAIRLARESGARLRVLHVVDEAVTAMPFQVPLYGDRLHAPLREAGRRLLARAEAQAARAGVKAQPRLVENLVGHVGDAIAREANGWKADLLVLGAHGRRGMAKLVMGSDAELAARAAKMPVLLVRAA
ncbi:MAG TPA: universal stress protein [Burkholderiales bacterium]|nr:universal stress protein [Burkholderiales bacterium]